MKVNYKQILNSKNRSINRQLKQVIYNDLIRSKQLKEVLKQHKINIEQMKIDQIREHKIVLN